MADILTLATYKTARGITGTTNDTQLEAIIEMVNSAIQAYCNRSFGEGIHTERSQGVNDASGRYFFHVKNAPIRSVQSIQVNFYGTRTPLDVDVSYLDIFYEDGYCYYSWVFDPSIGVIREEYRNNYYYDITYSGGEPVPKAVQLAAVTAVSDTFSYFQRLNTASGQSTPTGALKSVSIGDYSESYASEASSDAWTRMHDPKTGLVFSQTVQQLLNPFKHTDQSW